MVVLSSTPKGVVNRFEELTLSANLVKHVLKKRKNNHSKLAPNL